MSIASTRSIHFDLHPMINVTPRGLRSNNIEENNPTRKKFRRLVVYIMCAKLRGQRCPLWMAYMYDNHSILNIICTRTSMCHAGTRAGPRGAATWPRVPRRIHVGSRDKCTHFFHFLIILNHLKIEINSYKFRKNSRKIPINCKNHNFQNTTN